MTAVGRAGAAVGLRGLCGLRRNGGLAQERRLPPNHEKRRRQSDHHRSEQKTHEDASILQLISLLGP